MRIPSGFSLTLPTPDISRERPGESHTTITVAHRPTTLRFADRIVVLEAGKIVEGETHLDLVRRRGRHASFFNLHSGAA